MATAYNTTAYSYTRFSTPEQSKGNSYERQAQMAREYANREGLVLDESLQLHDAGRSGYHGDHATAAGRLGAFLALVRSGDVKPGSHLLVERLDRLSRQHPMVATSIVLEIIMAGRITVHTVFNGNKYSYDDIVGTNWMAWMQLQFELLQGHLESQSKSDRLKRTWSAKRARAREGGRPLTSTCPPWLRWDKATNQWVEIPERVEVVRRIFSDALWGSGQHSIAEALNLEGVPPFGSARSAKDRVAGRTSIWRRPYVRTLLANPAVVGTFTPKLRERDEVTNKEKRIRQPEIANYYPAIIEQEVFARVQELLKDRGAPLRGKHAGGEVRNIFGRLARCADCGSAMVLVNKLPRHYLVCEMARTKGDGARCEYRALRLDRLEAAFLAYYENLLAEMPSGTAGEEIEAELRNLEGALLALHEQHEALTAAQQRGFSAAIAERLRDVGAQRDLYRAEMAELMARREEVAAPMVKRKRDELHDALTVEPIDRMRVNTLLRQLFTSIRVECQPGGGFVWFEFEWKHGGETTMALGVWNQRAPRG